LCQDNSTEDLLIGWYFDLIYEETKEMFAIIIGFKSTRIGILELKFLNSKRREELELFVLGKLTTTMNKNKMEESLYKFHL